MKTRILGFLLLLCSLSYGQEDTSAVPFVAYWELGDTYQFKVSKIKQQWKEGELSKNDTNTYIATFEVIDSTDSSYKVKWTFDTDFDQFNIDGPLLGKFSEYQSTEVIFLTDELGSFVGIENWQEIAKMMNGLVRDIVGFATEGKKADQKELMKIMEPILSIYQSKEGVEQLVFKELSYFLFPFGVEFEVGETIEYEDQLPNMLGGDPIRANAKLYIHDVDFENYYCHLKQEMTVNDEDTKAVVLGLFKRMGLDDKDMKKALKSAEFDITDNNSFEYYYYPGVPINIRTERKTKVEIESVRVRQTDIIIIELLD